MAILDWEKGISDSREATFHIVFLPCVDYSMHCFCSWISLNPTHTIWGNTVGCRRHWDIVLIQHIAILRNIWGILPVNLKPSLSQFYKLHAVLKGPLSLHWGSPAGSSYVPKRGWVSQHSNPQHMLFLVPLGGWWNRAPHLSQRCLLLDRWRKRRGGDGCNFECSEVA